MMLKAYCSKIRAILKRQVWLAALWFVVLFFAQPVFAALLISDLRLRSSYPPNNDLLQVFGAQSVALMIILMIMAFITALVFGGYMHRQRQVDFYHSQPLPRNTLLLQHGAAGLLSILIPYLASQLLTVIVAMAMGAGAYFPWLGLLTGFLTHTLFLTAIFLTSLIAVAISGNGAVAMITGLFLLGVGPALMGLTLMIMDKFYPVFYESLYQWGMIVRWLSPAAAYVCLPINGLPHTIFPIIAYDVLAGLGVLAIYRRRKSEMAGQAIAFKPVKAPLKYAMALVASTVMAMIFNSIGDNGGGYFWWYFGAITGAFLATQITEIVYAFDFRAILRHLRGLAVFLVIYLVLTTCAMRDVTGFNKALPQAEQVASAEVYLPGINNYMMQGGGYYYGNNYPDPDSEIALLQMNEHDLLAMGPVTDPAAIAALVHMAGIFADDHEKEQRDAALLGTNKEYLVKYGDYGSPYVNSYPTQASMRVVFTLKNGRTFAREYQYQKPVQFLIEDLRVIYGQADFLAGQLTRLNHADEHYLPEYLQIFELYYPPAPLPQFTMAQRSQLLAALRADMLDLTVAEQEQTEPIGALNLRMYGGAADYKELENEQNGMRRPYVTQRIAIYPSFSRTLAFFADYGYSAKLWQPQLADIQSVKLYDQTVYYGDYRGMSSYEVTLPMAVSEYVASGQKAISDGQNVTEVTDPAEIAKIITNTYPSEATEYNSFIDIDRRVEAEVWYQGADGQSYVMRRVFRF